MQYRANLDRGISWRFAGAFGAKEPQRERGRADKPPPVQKRVEWALEVRGLDDDASIKKIIAAYRKLARTYHPDKVLELPAEAREIAERRMKEINAAYSKLKRRAGTPRGSGDSHSQADSIYRSYKRG